MKHWMTAALAASLSFAWPQGQAREAPDAPAAEAPAETIRWPVPWRAGLVLRYETENLESDVRPGKREKTRMTDTTTLRIVEATQAGFVQEWRSDTPDIEVIEGDPAMARRMEGVYDALAGLRILVELDKDANYKGIRNLEDIVRQMREAMRPLVISALDDALAKAPQGKAASDADKAEARRHVEKVMDGIASPAFVEGSIGQVVQNYNAFVGIALEDGARYEVDTELDNPMGATKFPARLTFGLTVSDEDPEDVFVEWTSTIDPERGAAAAWEIAEKLAGTAIPQDQRKALPKEIQIEDTGFVLFNRGSGVIEMYENERKVTLQDVYKVDRDRMRLLDDAHGHVWKEAPDGEAAPAAPVPAG